MSNEGETKDSNFSKIKDVLQQIASIADDGNILNGVASLNHEIEELNKRGILLGHIAFDSLPYQRNEILLHPYAQFFNSALVFAYPLDNKIMDEVNKKKAPTQNYYRHYNKVNFELDVLVNKISLILTMLGIMNRSLNPTVTSESLKSDNLVEIVSPEMVSHKKLAVLAGLGWIGKTGLLVTPEYGPMVRLASILLNIDENDRLATCMVDTFFNLSKKINKESKCASCNECVSACPTQAANGELWKIGVPRESYLDVGKCLEECRRQTLKEIGEKLSICGICVAACPRGRKKKEVQGNNNIGEE